MGGTRRGAAAARRPQVSIVNPESRVKGGQRRLIPGIGLADIHLAAVLQDGADSCHLLRHATRLLCRHSPR